MTENDLTKRGISRRTVARTAAWSVPAVAVAGAAPAFAATSAHWDVSVKGTCGDSGVKFTITNVGTTPIPVGTQFSLVSSKTIAVDVLGDGKLVGLDLVSTAKKSAAFVTTVAIPAGGTASYKLPEALIQVDALHTYTFALVTEEPSGASASGNSDTVSVVLGAKVLGIKVVICS